MTRNSNKHPDQPCNELVTLGWREWVSLPSLGVSSIKAKVDTGARTSALHAFNIEAYSDGPIEKVRFDIYPNHKDLKTVATCTSEVVDNRRVTDSGGHSQDRWVILVDVKLGASTWPIEVTLTSRDDMRFRMLLGRTAISKRAVVDPSRSYVTGKRLKKRKSGSK